MTVCAPRQESRPRSAVADLSIVIVTWNNEREIADCLRSIRADAAGLRCEVFVVDNASRDATCRVVRDQFPEVHLIANPDNRGFPIANNQAFERAAGRHTLILNPDTILRPGTLAQCVEYLETHPDTGAVGCRLIYPDGEIQYDCARRFPDLLTLFLESFYVHMLFPRLPLFGGMAMRHWDHRDSREVPCLMGAFILVRTPIVRELGGMNTDVFMFYEDMDFCYRIRRAGWKIYYLASAVTVHLHGASKHGTVSSLAGPTLWTFFRQHRGRAAAAACRGILLLRAVTRLALGAVVLAPLRVLQPQRRTSLTDLKSHWKLLKWALAFDRQDPGRTPVEVRTCPGRATPGVLMVGATPPPYHGSIMMFQTLMESPLRERFRLIRLDISDHRGPENIGRFDVENVRLGINHALACFRALKRERPEIVYVPVAMNALAFFRDSLFLHMARAFRRRCVIHAHGGYFGEFYRTAPAPLRAYIRWSLKGVDAAVVHSEALAPMFAGLVPEERIWPVANGIEGLSDPLHARLQSGDPLPAPRRPTVLYLGTLVETKGFLDVMAAAPLVAQELPDVRFVIAGAYFRPSDREKAECLMQDPAISAVVELPGVVAGDARFRLMLDASLFVFPSYYPVEGQPVVLLEAMSAGLPVVTTDQGAIRDTILHGETGYLVPKRDPAAMARRIVELLRDEPLRRRMGQAGRQRFEERFRVESYGLGMARVFDAVLEDAGRRVGS